MALAPGQKVAHYEVLALLGKGGMGEVYRARDSRLGRDVAIKVLPDEFAEDEERLRRFQREARVLASLNHPHIASIHGIESSGARHYLVLELVEGVTLAERIARGRIPADETLEIATKIAEALEEAHKQGIVHRDLKPANIKLTPEGKVKVLDFGLAKALVQETPEADRSMSPTISREATRSGVLLGTAAYMSPEQAKGRDVDKRTDIFAFGAVVYEMLTGSKAFSGETVSEVLASVLKVEPNWKALPPEVPPSWVRLLRRCLQKDPARRLHDIADARLELQEPIDEHPVLARPGSGASRLALTAVALGMLLGLGLLLWNNARPEMPQIVTRSVLPFPGTIALGWTPSVAISRDGRRIAFVGEERGERRIYLRNLDELEARPLDGTEGSHMPFFNPDGDWLGFEGPQGVMKVSLRGGAPVRLTGISGGRRPSGLDVDSRGASWGPQGIVLSPHVASGLSRVPASGGDLEELTSPDRARREKSHRFPHVLPDGEAVLFTLGTGDVRTFDDASIAAWSSKTSSYRVLLQGGTHPQYLPTGHLLYARDGRLFAAPFDPKELRLTGDAVPVLEGVRTSPRWGHAEFAVSENGTLAYVPGAAWGSDYRIVWVDRRGQKSPVLDTRGAYIAPRLSPSGRLLALDPDGANTRLEIFDLERGTLTPLVSGFDNVYPVWSPASDRLAFTSSREGQFNLFSVRADGGSPVERLNPSERNQFPSSWGRELLAFTETHPGSGEDIWILSMTGDRASRAILQSGANESAPAVSPDDRWIAYTSDESGREEVYLLPAQEPGGRRQVSTEGGSAPRWRADGRELFYLQGNQMMVVETRIDGEPQLGLPRRLFELDQGLLALYDVTPDGQRFVMVDASESEPPPREIILVQNWFEEVKRLAPGAN